MTITDDDLLALCELAREGLRLEEGVTNGPWEARPLRAPDSSVVVVMEMATDDDVGRWINVWGTNKADNAAFVADARTRAPDAYRALLRLVSELQFHRALTRDEHAGSAAYEAGYNAGFRDGASVGVKEGVMRAKETVDNAGGASAALSLLLDAVTNRRTT